MHLPAATRSLLAFVTLLTLLVAAATPVLAQDASPEAASPEPVTGVEECVEPVVTPEPYTDTTLSMPEEFRVALFEGVWQGIRDYYIDPDTDGLDWDALGDEYAPLIIRTDNAAEVYELLGEMVAELDDPFTNFYAPVDLGDEEAYDPTYGGIGALIDGSDAAEALPGVRILYVFEGGSAKDSGIAARDRVLGVNGDPCVRIADIRGPEGTELTLTVVSPGEEPREVTLERRRITPTTLPVADRLEVDPSVGYLQVLALSERAVIDAVEQALTTFMRSEPIEALILDLRASNQGAPGVMRAVLSHFVSGEVGEYHNRVGSEPIDIEPSDLAEAYTDVPLVVLVDEQTEADAEHLAVILQDQGRALVVGTQTSGMTHGADSIDYPDGSMLQLVVHGFRLPSGETLEGVGVTPDVPVDGDWMSYPEAEDPFLLVALEALEAARAAPSASPAA